MLTEGCSKQTHHSLSVNVFISWDDMELNTRSEWEIVLKEIRVDVLVPCAIILLFLSLLLLPSIIIVAEQEESNTPQQSWLKFLHTQLEHKETERGRKWKNLNQFFFLWGPYGWFWAANHMLKAFVMEIRLFGTFSLRSQAGHINTKKRKERLKQDQIFENTQRWKFWSSEQIASYEDTPWFTPDCSLYLYVSF